MKYVLDKNMAAEAVFYLIDVLEMIQWGVV